MLGNYRVATQLVDSRVALSSTQLVSSLVVGAEGLGKLIEIIHLVESRTRDLPAYNAVPQPLPHRGLLK
jgi:hypothetical protein